MVSSLQLLLIIIVSSAKSAPSSFPLSSCHEDSHSYAGIASPDSAIPPSSNSHPGNEPRVYFTKHFEEGKQECLDTLQNSSKLKPIQRQFLSQYGVLFIPFGPISTCSLHSKCWFGMLSCGEFKFNEFLQEYQQEIQRNRPHGVHMEPSPYLPNRSIPKFLGWSLQSLHLQFRIIGPEILFPEVVFLPLSGIIFCSYTLTLPGSYRIEIIPREFYPGILFNYTKQEMVEGYHLLGYKPLLTSIVPEITSYPMKASLGNNNCEKKNNNNIKPKHGQHATLPTPLPFCWNGNHTGRYLTIPKESLRICGGQEYLAIIKSLDRKHLPHDTLASTIERKFIAMDHTTHDQQLREYFIHQYQHNSSISLEQRLHFKELLRHTDEESSLCSLIVVNDFYLSPGLLDTRHEIFAPYECRYKFYSPLQVHHLSLSSPFTPHSSSPSHFFALPKAKQCLKNSNRRTSFSIGDSLSRDLFGFLNIYLNNSQVSLDQLRTLSTTNPLVSSLPDLLLLPSLLFLLFTFLSS
jgi:hypothetical protein